MRQNIKLLMIAIVIIALLATIGAYIALTPQYETIDVNGYKLEVPKSDVNITSVNDNFKIYDDKKDNITIKSYAINNVNESNYTGALEITEQLNSDKGQNCTYNNITLRNDSGNYTYFDVNDYQIIEITSNNLDSITHLVKSINKTEIKPQGNVTVNLKNITNDTANDTDSQTYTQTKKTTTKKTTSSNTKASSSSKSKYADDEVYDVVIPGTGGKTTKARRTGLTEYGNRYEEVGTGKAIYV